MLSAVYTLFMGFLPQRTLESAECSRNYSPIFLCYVSLRSSVLSAVYTLFMGFTAADAEYSRKLHSIPKNQCFSFFWIELDAIALTKSRVSKCVGIPLPFHRIRFSMEEDVLKQGKCCALMVREERSTHFETLYKFFIVVSKNVEFPKIGTNAPFLPTFERILEQYNTIPHSSRHNKGLTLVRVFRL